MKFYTQSVKEVLEHTGSRENGLTAGECAERLAKNGPNKLKEGKGKSIIRRFLEQLCDPMIIILLIAALISGVTAVLENESFADVIIILSVVLINAVLGVYQESKAEKAIEALQQMSAAKCKVIRDGNLQIVESETLVVGDIIALEAGDAVPADARLLESASLKVEEAALTGESVPVDKVIKVLGADGADVPLGDRKNMIYMGGTAVYGRGKAVVTATGMDTEMGKIAGVLAAAEDNETPLQKKLHQLSGILTWVVLGICLVVFGVQLLRAEDLGFDFLLSSFMVAVSLAVAAIPEGLAAVVTVVLSIGVTNMSKRGAIIRKLTAVETLGCAQIICSDKTGTLTQNKMTVVDYFGADEDKAASAMALCSDAEVDQNGEVTGEPTEAALVSWAFTRSLNKNELKQSFPRICEAPFDSGRKMMSTVHQGKDGLIQYTKGGMDVLLARCTHYLKDGQVLPLDDTAVSDIRLAAKGMADKALRVLAVAQRMHDAIPDASPENLEKELCFIGICGMIDPVRPEVKTAIAECKNAGIRAIMITGDHIDTARAIATELGILKDGERAVSGSELDKMDEETFEKEFQSFSVYARVQPEHKTRIVNAWKKAGFITAMTGDGVNDAPSIKSADIGVGMGITGTDVTKNVADMVLTDDNFATIVGAVEEGRRIYDNIRKSIQFLLGSNMSEVIAIFVATLLGFTVLKPVHLLWINLVTDTFPALALGMEKAEKNVMHRAPRKANEGIFAGGMGIDVIYQGAMVAALTLLSYYIGNSYAGAEHGMTMAFLTMSLAEVFHSFNMRSQRSSVFSIKHQNKVLWIAMIGSVIATTAVCEIPFLAAAFGLTAVGISEYALAALLGFAVIPIVEIVKLFQRVLKK